eukprot:TRINITY_DN20405_c0_g1_i1.p1 TRINITY_DN20405_c0_g1~~TRINITY_DN20405_c0_g1_i1.p1  ORF type:complete len:217 (+),score=79.93 TRINITY_DN20405_c0_g1_i1:83-652(+)
MMFGETSFVDPYDGATRVAWEAACCRAAEASRLTPRQRRTATAAAAATPPGGAAAAASPGAAAATTPTGAAAAAAPTGPSPARMLIIEIGCGLRVPSLRWANLELMKSFFRHGGQATLVRINPSPAECVVDFRHNSQEGCSHILIKDGAVHALSCIDAFVTAKLAQSASATTAATTATAAAPPSDHANT